MGGISLVTKGILGPIEGDVVYHQTELPLTVDAQVDDMTLELDEGIFADVNLPDEITAESVIEELETDVSVPLLDVTIEIELEE